MIGDGQVPIFNTNTLGAISSMIHEVKGSFHLNPVVSRFFPYWFPLTFIPSSGFGLVSIGQKLIGYLHPP